MQSIDTGTNFEMFTFLYQKLRFHAWCTHTHTHTPIWDISSWSL